MKDKYIVYCNQHYKESEFLVKNKCQFCGDEIRTSFGDIHLAECSILDIRCDEYARKYYLCKECGKKMIDKIEDEQDKIQNDRPTKE